MQPSSVNTVSLINPDVAIVEEHNYYPFGLEHHGYHETVNGQSYPYKTYQGQELVKALGLNWLTFKYRSYDPAIGRFLQVDPLAGKRSRFSPYNFVQNNPLNHIDPNGALDNPIYDRNGNFLGIDNKGLQGKAIIMNKSNFKLGMSHAEALKKDLGFEGLNSWFAVEKLLLNYDNLSKRPDWDGFVTISEGINWAKAHPNTLSNNITPENSLYLDASKLNFGNLSVADLHDVGFTDGTKKNVNLFNYVNWFSSKSRATTYALGNTQMKLLNAKTGSVKLYFDDYDWDYHNTASSTKRDNLIFLERMRTHLDDSHGFRVYIYGTGKIKTD